MWTKACPFRPGCIGSRTTWSRIGIAIKGRRKIIALDDYVALSLKSEAPERQTEDLEEKEQLMRAVRNLPEDRQQLLLLKFIEQLSNAEIGRIMGRTEGAVKSLYHRTLLALRDELSGARADEPGGQLDGTGG